MPSPIPVRRRNTFFLGAGFSRALNLPNTAELLGEVAKAASERHLALTTQLREAYKYFYPEEATSFVPEVVDFFSVLRAYEDVGRGLPGAFKYPGLLNDLRFAIARVLTDRVREVDIPAAGWRTLDEIFAHGNVVITSNWDLLVEWYASKRNIRLRLGGPPEDSVLTLIKLHGSVDWTLQEHRRAGKPDGDYAALRELQNSHPKHTIAIGDDQVLRIRAVEHMTRCWQFIKARTTQPLMITMAQGKSVDMEPIKSMWDDAYRALGETKRLRIIGYSLPDDDIEIRTLLRAGVARGEGTAGYKRPEVVVLNPEPSVHVRMRTYVDRYAKSDYGTFRPS